jgi:alpha-tubulin suppressor-like RCC1 family protein
VAWCWGGNASGQLGDASEDDALTPVEVTGDLSWDRLALGEEFSCGLASDGIVRCWGSSGDGWLGDGSGEPQPTPTPVAAVS